MTDEQIHALAREKAARYDDIDRKQLRFNEIVSSARKFYPNALHDGVGELVDACSRKSPLYVPKRPMWATLTDQYGWIVE